jgi:Flp pilus assembly protein TadD
MAKKIADHPADHAIRTEYGKLLMAIGRKSEAVIEFDEAIRLDDANATEAYFSKGMLEVQENRLESARILFNEAAIRDPLHFASLNGLGMIAMRTNENENALTYFQRATGAYSGNASVQANLGLVLMRLGRVNDAIAPLEAALAIEPDNPKRSEMLENARLLLKQAR